MSHRKGRETNQQLIRLPDLALLGCSLLSLHILCDILQTFTVLYRVTGNFEIKGCFLGPEILSDTDMLLKPPMNPFISSFPASLYPVLQNIWSKRVISCQQF